MGPRLCARKSRENNLPQIDPGDITLVRYLPYAFIVSSSKGEVVFSMKNVKSLICLGVLALSTLSVASAKSYNIIIGAPTKVGSTQLMPGEYKLKVDGANAVFTQEQTRKETSVPVKIENGSKKFENTVVNSSKQGDMDQIKEIQLGGSTTKLQFGQ